MANDTYEEAIEGLKKLLSEKNELEEVAAAKVRQLTAELAGAAEKPAFDPVERIRTGFEHFKKENYECWNLLGIIDNCEILGDAD